MSRRVIVRAIAFLAFAFSVLIAMSVQNMRRASRYEQVISDGYSYAFAELLAGITKLDYALEKCSCSNDAAMLVSLCGEVFREAENSSRALSRLPVSELSLENTTKFISRTGDYAYYLMKKAARGEFESGEATAEIADLAKRADSLMYELQSISARVNEEGADLAKIKLSEGGDAFFEDIRLLEREFSEYPVLIYDGPFSDETEGTKELLSGLDAVSDEDLLKTAAEFVNAKKEGFSIEEAHVEDGIELVTVTDGAYYVDITRLGGKVFRVISSKTAENSSVPIEVAVEKGKEILGKNGYTDMVQTYYMRYGNTLTVNFAATSKGVTVYPDLVKITVSLEDGSLVNFDAAGYIKNHKKRDTEDISKTRDEAKKRVSEELQIMACSPAIIPTDGTGELLTHEFICRMRDGTHCIVYINPHTLHEERILILIESDNGTLVM